MFEDQRGRQPYITAVYDKVDAIRFEVFMRSVELVVSCSEPGEDELPVAMSCAETLMQAALHKMEGLEIIQRRHPVIETESPIEKAKELLRVSAIDHTCPLCSGDGVLY